MWLVLCGRAVGSGIVVPCVSVTASTCMAAGGTIVSDCICRYQLRPAESLFRKIELMVRKR
jgi:hypothetical protein